MGCQKEKEVFSFLVPAAHKGTPKLVTPSSRAPCLCPCRDQNHALSGDGFRVSATWWQSKQKALGLLGRKQMIQTFPGLLNAVKSSLLTGEVGGLPCRNIRCENCRWFGNENSHASFCYRLTGAVWGVVEDHNPRGGSWFPSMRLLGSWRGKGASGGGAYILPCSHSSALRFPSHQEGCRFQQLSREKGRKPIQDGRGTGEDFGTEH